MLENYQKRLLEIAGWRDKDNDGNWYCSQTKQWHPASRLENVLFDSLDWLETYIMPAVREKYKIGSERFSKLLGGGYIYELYTYPQDDNIAHGYGETKVFSLLEALKNLVEEKKMNINKADAKRVLGLIAYQTPSVGLSPMNPHHRTLAAKNSDGISRLVKTAPYKINV